MTPNIRRYRVKIVGTWWVGGQKLSDVIYGRSLGSGHHFNLVKRSQKKSKKRGSGLGPTIQSGSAAHASTLKEGLTFLKSQLNVISQFFKVWVF